MPRYTPETGDVVDIASADGGPVQLTVTVLYKNGDYWTRDPAGPRPRYAMVKASGALAETDGLETDMWPGHVAGLSLVPVRDAHPALLSVLGREVVPSRFIPEERLHVARDRALVLGLDGEAEILRRVLLERSPPATQPA